MIIITTLETGHPEWGLSLGFPGSLRQVTRSYLVLCHQNRPLPHPSQITIYLSPGNPSPQADPCPIVCPPVTANHPWHITLLNVQSETPKATLMPVHLHRPQRHASRCAFNTSQLFPLLTIPISGNRQPQLGKGATTQLK